LTAIAILVAIVLYSETKKQVKIAQDALEYQRIADSSSGAYQWRRDSVALAKTDSSLKFTRQSNERAERGLRITEKNMFLTTEISKIAIQPFLFADTIGEIQDLRVGLYPYNEISFVNVGATPAYKVMIWTNIIFESEYNQDSLNKYPSRNEEVGWFVGTNKRLATIKAYFYGGETWKTGDSIAYKKNPLLLMIRIGYEDAFGRFRITQEGLTQTPAKPYWSGLRKYIRTDHDKK
jgi:hypothetical protein